MEYRRLGRTGLSISALGYGTARGNTDTPQQMIGAYQAALDRGINFFDTATGYDNGDSEVILGKALHGHPEVLIETKYCPYDTYLPDAEYVGTPQALISSVEQSLKRLKRDHVDVLLGHGMRSSSTLDRFMNDGCYEAMCQLKQQGKVRFIGISELSEADGTHQVLQKAVPTGAFDVVMVTINIFLQTAIDTVLPLCSQHDVGTVVMMPLNQASKMSGLVSVPAALECVRRHITAGNLPAEAPYIQPDLFDFAHPYSIPELALRFVLAQDISTCCVGMRSAERVASNTAIVDGQPLNDDLMEKIKQLFGKIQSQVR